MSNAWASSWIALTCAWEPMAKSCIRFVTKAIHQSNDGECRCDLANTAESGPIDVVLHAAPTLLPPGSRPLIPDKQCLIWV